MSSFQIFSPAEIESLRQGGKILRGALELVAKRVRPGVTTGELDRLAEEYILSQGARPAFKGYNGFTGTLCTSINEEAVHGIPGDRELAEGDIVSLDCGVVFDGLYTDACVTVAVGEVDRRKRELIQATEEALAAACAILRAGVRVGDISATIQEHVERAGFRCIPVLTGHGLGKTLHQFPDVPNVGKGGAGPVLPERTIIAIEPITCAGKGDVRDAGDGWTLVTKDSTPAAHAEHTVLILAEGCEILA